MMIGCSPPPFFLNINKNTKPATKNIHIGIEGSGANIPFIVPNNPVIAKNKNVRNVPLDLDNVVNHVSGAASLEPSGSVVIPNGAKIV